jgi:hypothetical protein
MEWSVDVLASEKRLRRDGVYYPDLLSMGLNPANTRQICSQMQTIERSINAHKFV